MRELSSHKVTGLNEVLRIEVLDEPGSGNACHLYKITSDEPRSEDTEPAVSLTIQFQNGPIAEAGVNGVSIEALLAVALDRLVGFQSGPYACYENAIALMHVNEAIMWLRNRTLDREARGVEGTRAI